MRVIPFSLKITLPPVIGFPCASVIVAFSVRFSPMYPVCLFTVMVVGSFCTFRVYSLLLGWYVLDPSYVILIVCVSDGKSSVMVVVPVLPVCVFIFVPSGSVMVIGALAMLVLVTGSFTVMLILVSSIVLFMVLMSIVAFLFVIVTSFSVVLLGV